MSITVKMSQKNNIYIINTYARHMMNNKGGRTNQWYDIKNNIQNTNKNDCIIWFADNNGQISNDNDENAKKTYLSYGNKTETGNGDK